MRDQHHFQPLSKAADVPSGGPKSARRATQHASVELHKEARVAAGKNSSFALVPEHQTHDRASPESSGRGRGSSVPVSERKQQQQQQQQQNFSSKQSDHWIRSFPINQPSSSILPSDDSYPSVRLALEGGKITLPSSVGLQGHSDTIVHYPHPVQRSSALIRALETIGSNHPILYSREPIPVKLFATRIPKTVLDSQYRELFARFGKVLHSAILKDAQGSKGCGFVTFACIHQAHDAIVNLHAKQTFSDDTRPINVKYANGELKRLGLPFEIQPGGAFVKLYVGRLPKRCTEKDLEPLFSKYGRVDEVYLIRDEHQQSRCSAFVTYPKYEMAAAAISALNGSFSFPGTNHTIEVRFSESKRTRERASRNKKKMDTSSAAALSKTLVSARTLKDVHICNTTQEHSSGRSTGVSKQNKDSAVQVSYKTTTKAFASMTTGGSNDHILADKPIRTVSVGRDKEKEPAGTPRLCHPPFPLTNFQHNWCMAATSTASSSCLPGHSFQHFETPTLSPPSHLSARPESRPPDNITRVNSDQDHFYLSQKFYPAQQHHSRGLGCADYAGSVSTTQRSGRQLASPFQAYEFETSESALLENLSAQRVAMSHSYGSGDDPAPLPPDMVLEAFHGSLKKPAAFLGSSFTFPHAKNSAPASSLVKPFSSTRHSIVGVENIPPPVSKYGDRRSPPSSVAPDKPDSMFPMTFQSLMSHTGASIRNQEALAIPVEYLPRWPPETAPFASSPEAALLLSLESPSLTEVAKRSDRVHEFPKVDDILLNAATVLQQPQQSTAQPDSSPCRYDSGAVGSSRLSSPALTSYVVNRNGSSRWPLDSSTALAEYHATPSSGLALAWPRSSARLNPVSSSVAPMTHAVQEQYYPPHGSSVSALEKVAQLHPRTQVPLGSTTSVTGNPQPSTHITACQGSSVVQTVLEPSPTLGCNDYSCLQQVRSARSETSQSTAALFGPSKPTRDAQSSTAGALPPLMLNTLDGLVVPERQPSFTSSSVGVPTQLFLDSLATHTRTAAYSQSAALVHAPPAGSRSHPASEPFSPASRASQHAFKSKR